MPSVLNFRKSELPLVESSLRQYDELPAQKYQRRVVRISDCTATLFESGKLVISGKNEERVSKRILENIRIPDELVVGIDETGRGENFGPLVVCGILGWNSRLREVRDSKKTADIAAKKKIVQQNANQAIALEFDAKTIDQLRRSGMNLNQIEAKAIDWICDFFRGQEFKGKIVVDGNSLPAKTNGIVFLPKADDSEPTVAAASIVAKFIRDSSFDRTKRETWKTKPKKPA